MSGSLIRGLQVVPVCPLTDYCTDICHMSERIINNPDKNRFETEVEGHLCVLDYELEDSTVRMTHVGVPDAVGGRGIAGDLTRTALNWAREAGYSVQPDCPYVKAWIGKHPEYADLVP